MCTCEPSFMGKHVELGPVSNTRDITGKGFLGSGMACTQFAQKENTLHKQFISNLPRRHNPVRKEATAVLSSSDVVQGLHGDRRNSLACWERAYLPLKTQSFAVYTRQCASPTCVELLPAVFCFCEPPLLSAVFAFDLIASPFHQTPPL